MLELRYAGCPDCLSSMKAVLRNVGYYPSKNYRVTYHDDHRKDAIYTKRPDYLKKFTGGILYNPDTEQWLDFYDTAHEKLIVKANTEDEKRRLLALLGQLEAKS